MDHKTHCDITANDMVSVADLIKTAADDVRAGDIDAFRRMFIEGGTEEGDARINYLRELLLCRFAHREEQRATHPTKDTKQ
jgi:hypothetical protein